MLDRALDRARDAGRATAGGPLATAAGITAGCAALTRPAMLFFLPLAALWLFRQRRAPLAVLLIVAALATVAPWTIRNARVFHRFVLIASEGGVTFWTGNHPLASGEGDMAANPDIKRAEIEFRRARPGLTPEELEPEYYRAALGYIAAHPWWWLGLLARKAVYTVRADRSVVYATLDERTGRPRWRRTCCSCRARRSAGGGSGPGAGRTALFMHGGLPPCCTGLVFFPQERFRIPVIDPALIVCAAGLRSPPLVIALTNVLVVVPTYNERDNLPLLVQGVLAHPGLPDAGRRRRLARRHRPDRRRARRASIPGRLEVMHRTGRRGLGRSYIDGLRARARHGRRRSDLPDGRRPLAQPRLSAGAGRRRRRRTTWSSARAT